MFISSEIELNLEIERKTISNSRELRIQPAVCVNRLASAVTITVDLFGIF